MQNGQQSDELSIALANNPTVRITPKRQFALDQFWRPPVDVPEQKGELSSAHERRVAVDDRSEKIRHGLRVAVLRRTKIAEYGEQMRPYLRLETSGQARSEERAQGFMISGSKVMTNQRVQHREGSAWNNRESTISPEHAAAFGIVIRKHLCFRRDFGCISFGATIIAVDVVSGRTQ